MSDSRKTPAYWGVGIAILLVAYVASPPLLAFVWRGSPPGPQLGSFLDVFYTPLNMLYEASPWYKHYIDVTYEMAVP
jgi:hypothetical protein